MTNEQDNNVEEEVVAEVEVNETVNDDNTDNASADKEPVTPPVKTLEEQIDFLKQASRKHEANSRNNLKKFKETEELLNTTLQEKETFAAQLEVFKKEAESATRQNIALKYGLSDLVASRLQGENKDELEADAQKWVAEFGETTPKTNSIQGSIKNKLETAASQFQQAQAKKFG